MEDREIVKLFLKRDERAIEETRKKYDSYCRKIAFNVLGNEEDSEECVSSALLKTWDSIPPQKPQKLSAYLGKITRNLALDAYRKQSAEKRGNGQTVEVLDELRLCVSKEDTEKSVDTLALRDALNRFLRELPEEKSKIFIRRYWYLDSISTIASDFSISESKLKSLLMRTRKQLKDYLQKEGIDI